MNSYRTLAVAALAFSAFAAQADSPCPRWRLEQLPADQPDPLFPTREAVVADLVASRAAGTLPRDGEWYNVPAPLNIQGVTATAGTDAGKNSVAASQSGRSTAAE